MQIIFETKLAQKELYFECKNSCVLLQKIQADNEKLREIIMWGTIEVEKRNRRIAELEAENAELKLLLKKSEEENKLLKEQLEQEKAKVNLLIKWQYGRKTEKRQIIDTYVKPEYEEVEEGYIVEKINRGAKPGHKGYGRKIPKNLPVEMEVIDLPEDEKYCKKCGKPLIDSNLRKTAESVSFKKIYFLKRFVRIVYKRVCDCAGSKLVVAPLPKKLIPKSKFSNEFWMTCLIDKYFNHLPITRQVSEMKLYGLEVSKGTIFGGLKTIYFKYIKPLHMALIEEIRDSKSLVQVDESGWHIFIKVKDKDGYNWFMWVFISDKVVVFVVDMTRSSKVPLKVLFNINKEDIKNISNIKDLIPHLKTLLVDKYVGYEALLNLGIVLLAYCWAHQRREFIDLATKYPHDEQIIRWVDMWKEKISELYRVNDERIKYKPEEPEFAYWNNKLESILNWMKQETEKDYQHPGQKSVMDSMKKHWEGLTLFVKHPEIPLDNNLVERILRFMVIGRKNYWGNHSIWGGELSAAMFSIIHTCLLNDICPEAYLQYYLNECIKKGSAPNEDEIKSYLPHNISQEIKKKLSINARQIFDDS